MVEAKKFRFNQSEAFAHATPFEKGTKEYALSLEMVTKEKAVVQLLSFVDRVNKSQGRGHSFQVKKM